MQKINFKELAKGLLIIVSYLVILPIFISAMFQILNLDLTKTSFYLLANLSIYLIALAFLVFYHRKTLKSDFKNFKNNFKNCFKVAITNYGKSLILSTLCNLLLISLTGDIAQNESANRNIITLYPLFSILTMVFIGPFIEEMVFRKSMKKAFNNKNYFLIISALIFGSAHILISLDFSSLASFASSFFSINTLFVIPYSVMGYFLARSYVDTDSIFTSTLMHMFNNGLAVFAAILGAMYGI